MVLRMCHELIRVLCVCEVCVCVYNLAYKVGTIIIVILQRWKLKFREVKWLAQGHTTRTGMWIPACLAPESAYLSV